MKKAFVLATVLLAVLVVLSGCNSKDDSESSYQLFKNGVESVINSDSIAYNFEFSIGKNDYKMSVQETDDGDKKYAEISMYNADITVYSTGGKNYYEFGENKYSISSSKDSAVFKELLDFKFFNGSSGVISEDVFEDVSVENDGDGKYIEFEVNGETFKKMIAPDEDVSFDKTELRVDFDKDGFITKVEFSTDASGDEFYGLIVGSDKSMTATFEINSLDEVDVKEPSDDEKWPESEIMAILAPGALVYSEAVGAEVDGKMEMNVMGMEFKIPMKISVRSQTVDGKQLTRTVTEITGIILGQSIEEKNDVFTDGNGDFEYYTHPDGNYKKPIESDSDKDDSGADLSYEDVFGDATIEKAGRNTVITCNLSQEALESLMSNQMAGGMGDMNNITGADVAFSKCRVVMVVSDKGYIHSVELEMSANQTIKEESLNMEYEMSISFEMNVTFMDPTEKIVVEVPEGYLEYPLQDDSEAVL